MKINQQFEQRILFVFIVTAIENNNFRRIIEV